MTRPSRNVDRLLLRAGRELFPETGVAQLSVRKVAIRAGVNPGMFHYHFGNKDLFVRQLLQELYDEMFASLELAASARLPGDALKAALNVLGRFARDNGTLMLSGCGNSTPPGYPGYVEADYVRVAAPLSGSLARLSVNRGDEVAANAPLFVLESAQEAAARAEAESRARQAEATLADLEKARRPPEIAAVRAQLRSEERRVGKEGGAR